MKTTIWRVRAARCRTRARPSTFAGSIACTGSSITAKRNGDSSSAARGRKTLTDSASSSPCDITPSAFAPSPSARTSKFARPLRPDFLSVIVVQVDRRALPQLAPVLDRALGDRREAFARAASSAAPLTHFSASLSAFSVAARASTSRASSSHAATCVESSCQAAPRRDELRAGAVGERAQRGSSRDHALGVRSAGAGDGRAAGARRGAGARRAGAGRRFQADLRGEGRGGAGVRVEQRRRRAGARRRARRSARVSAVACSSSAAACCGGLLAPTRRRARPACRRPGSRR